MMMLILFFIFMAVPFVCSAAARMKTEDTLVLGPLSAVVLLYAFGICGALQAGFWSVLLLTGLCYVYGMLRIVLRRGLRSFVGSFFTPLFWTWLILFGIIWFVDRGKLVHFYDEFTHWGDVVWVMNQHDLLATQANARSLFSTYPPTMALWQYFVQKVNLILGGVYREDLLYMASHWFMLSLYMPFISRLNYRRPWQISFAAGTVFMLPLFVFRSSAYALIYIDSFLSMLGGFVLIYAFQCDDRKPIEMTTLALSLAALVLTKDVGVLFAAGGAVVFAASVSIRRGVERKGLLLIAGVIGTVIAAWASWKLHIALSGAEVAQASFQQSVDLSELVAIAKGTSLYPWRRTVLNKYINQFFIPIFYLWPTNAMITHASLLLLAGGGLAWLANVMSKREEKWGRCFRWVGYGWGAVVIAYIVGMGILYLFKYNYEEAIVLSAWNRYMDTIVAYGVFAFAAGCMLAMKERLMTKTAKIAVITLMLALLPWAGAVDTLSCSETENTHASQNQWIALADEVRTVSEMDGLGDDARVYLVYGSDTQPFLSMRYRLRPMQVNDESWALGQYNNDPGVEKIVPAVDEMRLKLADEYDYLILCAAEKEFAAQYGELFASEEVIHQGSIYRIEKETGLLQLCN